MSGTAALAGHRARFRADVTYGLIVLILTGAGGFALPTRNRPLAPQ